MKKKNGDFNDEHDHNGNQFKENEYYPGNGSLKKSNYCFWNPTRMTNALRAQLFFKRLNAYAVSMLACAVILMPLYLGGGYTQVLERAVVASVPSLQFWLPRFRLLLFLWPSNLPFPSQVAHALSITFLSIEQL